MTVVPWPPRPAAIVPPDLRDRMISEFAPAGWGPGVVTPSRSGVQLCAVRARRERDGVTVYVARQGRRGGLAWTPWIGDAQLAAMGPRAALLFDDALDHAHDLRDVELVDVSVVGGHVKASAA